MAILVFVFLQKNSTPRKVAFSNLLKGILRHFGYKIKLRAMNLNDKNDLTIKTIIEEKELPYSELTRTILGCCFAVMKELGPGFLEKVYKNALLIAMRQKGLEIEVEQPFEVILRGKVVGRYNADLVVGKAVIVEVKCCESLIREHQAQLFNYLKVAGLPIGLLVNFRRRKLEWKRLQSNEEYFDLEEMVNDKEILF
jgi:GxxExxY protein